MGEKAYEYTPDDSYGEFGTLVIRSQTASGAPSIKTIKFNDCFDITMKKSVTSPLYGSRKYTIHSFGRDAKNKVSEIYLYNGCRDLSKLTLGELGELITISLPLQQFNNIHAKLSVNNNNNVNRLANDFSKKLHITDGGRRRSRRHRSKRRGTKRTRRHK
jgi:hypothetical protein